jgi:RNA-directed DNA polymerase
MIMEAVVERENMHAAYAQVMRNHGAAGADAMPVEALKAHRQVHWPSIKEQLLNGTYKPQPVRKVEIPKPDGKGTRTLGIPTVVDRLIQQALHQVLVPIFDPTFSESSYGFRPGRSARVRRRGKAMGRGHRPGEILRPRQPRHPHVARGTADQ